MGSNGPFGGGVPPQPLTPAMQAAHIQRQQLLAQQQLALMQMQAQAQQWVGGSNGSVWIGAGTNSPGIMQFPNPTPPVLKPDPTQPDTLGWREWVWSPADKMLKSPSTGTLWPEAELVVPTWDDGEAVRGVSGIHAHLVPKHWKILGEQGGGYVAPGDPNRVHGIVERFGKYVLGTEGWRAEWVIIKELMAPSTAVGLEIEQAYPDVIVHYPDEEGDDSCTLATLSKLGKGSRPTNRPKPSPQPSQSPSPSFSQVSPQSTPTLGNPLANSTLSSQSASGLQNANANWYPSSQPAPSPPPLYGSLSSSESEPRRDFAHTFLATGPIWVGGLLVAWLLLVMLG
jgi:hypothetical protein